MNITDLIAEYEEVNVKNIIYSASCIGNIYYDVYCEINESYQCKQVKTMDLLDLALSKITKNDNQFREFRDDTKMLLEILLDEE